jgi:molybdopterin/thiamine biosynthesis adenylyltransferase
VSGFPARYDRSIRLFGAEGQRKLRQTKVVVVGVGGLGSSLAQHIALLGLGEAALVDDQELDETNRNRFVGARSSDSVPGSPKVELAVRLIREINPEVVTVPIKRSLVTSEAFDVIKNADWVFGCLDEDGPRFILNELCAAYAIPYVDLASDVPEPGIYGGRVCIASDGKGCVSCLRVLDQRSVRRYLATEEEREKEDAIYGISRLALGEAGPSVSPINGVIAALAATEFMVAATGMRAPTRLLEYRAHISKVLVINDAPSPNCYYCRGIRGKQAEADAERYLKVPHLRDGTMTARA